MATINLALNRPATASNSVMPYTPSKAVNGVATSFSRWLCNKVPGWLCVDFGAPYWISRWVAKQMPIAGWRSPDYNMCDFKLQGSNDNINWTDIDVVANNIASTYDKKFTPAFFRYARVYVTKGLRINTQYASLMEFEVYEAPRAYLTALTISSGALSPTFAKTTFPYTAANVPYTTSSVTVTPTAEDPQATIKVNGVAVVSGNAATVALNVGSNVIPVVVTGADGAPSYTYTITIVRVGSPYLTNLTLKDVPLTFAKNTYAYTASVANSVASTVVTPTLEDGTAAIAITVNGTAVTAGQTVNLNVGANTINVLVTAYGGAQQNYTVTVTRAAVAYLTGLGLSTVAAAVVPYTPVFDKAVIGYAASVGYDVAQVVVTPTTDIVGATITVNGVALTGGSVIVSLVVGGNPIPVVVTNGTATKTYTVTVTRASSAYLTSVDVIYVGARGNVKVTVVINKNQTEYTADIPNTTSSVTITAYSEDINAKILVNGNQNLTNGQVSTSIPVTPGVTRIPINVTSNIGTDNKAYGVTIV